MAEEEEGGAAGAMESCTVLTTLGTMFWYTPQRRERGCTRGVGVRRREGGRGEGSSGGGKGGDWGRSHHELCQRGKGVQAAGGVNVQGKRRRVEEVGSGQRVNNKPAEGEGEGRHQYLDHVVDAGLGEGASAAEERGGCTGLQNEAGGRDLGSGHVVQDVLSDWVGVRREERSDDAA